MERSTGLKLVIMHNRDFRSVTSFSCYSELLGFVFFITFLFVVKITESNKIFFHTGFANII